MGKKKQLPTGFLAIDPSWRGCGYAAYFPEEDLIKVGCVDLVDRFTNRKKLYDTPESSRDLVFCFLTWLLEEELGPELRLKIGAVVLERQFKTKMQNLYKCFDNQIRALLGIKTKIIGIAAWNTKQHFGTATGTYTGNKREAISFLERNPELIGAELHDKNDNKADAIILLNHLLQKKYPEILMSRRNAGSVVHRPPYSRSVPDNDSDIDCPECGTPCVIKACGPQAKTPGREYNACIQPSCPKSDKGGFICFVGEQPKQNSSGNGGARTAGAKRNTGSRPSVSQLSDDDSFEPATKRRANNPISEVHSAELIAQSKLLVKQMADFERATINYLDEILGALVNNKQMQETHEICGTTDNE